MLNTNQSGNAIWWALGALAVVLFCCCLAAIGFTGLAFGLAFPFAGQEFPVAPAPVVTVEVGPGGFEPDLAPDEDLSPSGPTAIPGVIPTRVPPRPAQPSAQGDLPTQGTGDFATAAALAEAVVPARDLRVLAEGLRGTGPIPEVVRETPLLYEAGDAETFWVSNGDTSEHRQIDAEMVYSNDVLYIWVEEGLDYDLDDLQAAADRFAEETYPTNRNFFGTEWTPGIDGDPKLHILHSDKLGDRIAGYFSGADAVSRLAQPYSNEREMFYIHLGNAEPNSEFYNGVLSHEFQHMIHWYEDKNEATWVNEGMSELATELNGYSRGGADQAFSLIPDTQLTSWNDDPNNRSQHYGGAYLFMSYFLQRFGNEMTQAVVASKANGVDGFNEVLEPMGLSFDEVFADWVVANYLDAPELGDGRYGYERDDPMPMEVDARHRRYPIQREAEVSQYGTDYIELTGNGDVELTFQGGTTTQLAANTAHSGSFAWWANRVDDSDARLTRAFDLSGVDAATLRFWTWYDIEDDYDYGYVMVSTDDGATWTPLQTEDMTDENPNGNSFGWALTGCSGDPGSQEAGDSCEAEWIEQTADLAPYAGQEVLVRFQYITDDAVNYPGFFVDDISIPEIGFSDDVEADAGWQSEGWIRTDNVLPQQWLVQVIQRNGDAEPAITRLEVDENGQGTWVIPGLSRTNRATLAISALAPVTTEKAPYQYAISEP